MDNDFTATEIKDVVRTARIYCPDFSEDMFTTLMELEKRIIDASFLETVRGLLRLEEEKDVSCTEAIDACEELMAHKAKLEREVPELEKRSGSLTAQIKQLNADYEKARQSVAKAYQELEQRKNECAAAEKKLGAFYRKMEREKQHIEKEVEDCYQRANVTKEEVVTAGKVKDEVESHGFTLELMLDLSREFAGHKNAREKLAEGLKEHGSLNKYLIDLTDRCNKERTRVTAEIEVLESQKKRLTSETVYMNNVLSKLQADIDGEEELRRFYNRYVSASSLMEHLARWNQIFFVRCPNPAYVITGAFSAGLGNAHFWTDKPPVMCPSCGYRHLVYDEGIYQALNWPIGVPLRLKLGEGNGDK